MINECIYYHRGEIVAAPSLGSTSWLPLRAQAGRYDATAVRPYVVGGIPTCYSSQATRYKLSPASGRVREEAPPPRVPPLASLASDLRVNGSLRAVLVQHCSRRKLHFFINSKLVSFQILIFTVLESRSLSARHARDAVKLRSEYTLSY